MTELAWATAVAAVALVLALPLVAPAQAAPTRECPNAVNQYNSTVSDMESRIRRYWSCLSDSRAQDDCSSEFSRVRSVQSDFENAVNSYRNECQ